MGATILLIVIILLVVVGIITSIRFYSEGVIGTGRFRNIRRIRTIRSTPDGKVIEDTTEEIMDEEEPVEEAES